MLLFGKRYIGRNYGGYRICGLMGQGRYGACFKAVSPDGQEVVLKRFHNYMKRKNREKNHFEPVILSALSHPSVPSLLGVVNTGRDYFFVLEKMPGDSIETMLFSMHHKFSEEEIYQIGLRLMDILSYLHANHIVHRDIRPANVLWDGSRVCLLDFGLARFFEAGKYHPSSDFSYLADFLLYLLYSAYPQKKAGKNPWYEELPLCPKQIRFLKRLFGQDAPYETIVQIRADFQHFFAPPAMEDGVL